MEEVVVTGSNIRGAPTDAALPVSVIGSEELQKRGSPCALELIKQLPMVSGILGDTNQFDSRAQGTSGSGSVNLRGLGAERTLVLLNGRRRPPTPRSTRRVARWTPTSWASRQSPRPDEVAGPR